MPTYFVLDNDNNVLAAYEGPEDGKPNGAVIVDPAIHAGIVPPYKGFKYAPPSSAKAKKGQSGILISPDSAAQPRK